MRSPPWSIQRLNLDACWWASLGGPGVVFDPWLVGSEVDGWPWFNEQWHTGPVVAPEELPAHAVTVVSQRFADHCHPETLARLPRGPTLAAVPDALASVAAATGREVAEIPPWGAQPLQLDGLRLWRVSRPWWHPPAYHAVVVADDQDRAVLHAPHGLPAALGAEVASRLAVEVLATSRTSFRLPWFLGGHVNPGPEAADALALATRARWALPVHDEDKRGHGLVGRIARVARPGLDTADPSVPWLPHTHVSAVRLDAVGADR